jgi:hypothetical protein
VEVSGMGCCWRDELGGLEVDCEGMGEMGWEIGV